jgi:hypothetical protein
MSDMSDSDLRQALLGTWRLVGLQETVDGAVVKPFGDNPPGPILYTPRMGVYSPTSSRECILDSVAIAAPLRYATAKPSTTSNLALGRRSVVLAGHARWYSMVSG